MADRDLAAQLQMQEQYRHYQQESRRRTARRQGSRSRNSSYIPVAVEPVPVALAQPVLVGTVPVQVAHRVQRRPVRRKMNAVEKAQMEADDLAFAMRLQAEEIAMEKDRVKRKYQARREAKAEGSKAEEEPRAMTVSTQSDKPRRGTSRRPPKTQDGNAGSEGSKVEEGPRATNVSTQRDKPRRSPSRRSPKTQEGNAGSVSRRQTEVVAAPKRSDRETKRIAEGEEASSVVVPRVPSNSFDSAVGKDEKAFKPPPPPPRESQSSPRESTTTRETEDRPVGWKPPPPPPRSRDSSLSARSSPPRTVGNDEKAFKPPPPPPRESQGGPRESTTTRETEDRPVGWKPPPPPPRSRDSSLSARSSPPQTASGVSTTVATPSRGREPIAPLASAAAGGAAASASPREWVEGTGGEACYHCRAPLSGSMTTAVGRTYHQACFVCDWCGGLIVGSEFEEERAGVFHSECREKFRNANCVVCQEKVREVNGRIDCNLHPFWREPYCPEHDQGVKTTWSAKKAPTAGSSTSPRTCFTCGRMERQGVSQKPDRGSLMERFKRSVSSFTSLPVDDGRGGGDGSSEVDDVGDFLKLEDGRCLCRSCARTAVMGTDEVKTVVLDVKRFLQSIGLPLRIYFPVLLVDGVTLNEFSRRQQEGSAVSGGRGGIASILTQGLNGGAHSHGRVGEDSTTHGLCINETCTVMKMVCTDSDTPPSQVPYEIVKKRAVNAILILYGVPRDLLGSVIAHELMHAWIRIQPEGKVPLDVPPTVKEGLCQLMAFLYLSNKQLQKKDAPVGGVGGAGAMEGVVARGGQRKKKTEGGSDDVTNASLREYFLHQIKTHSSVVYGRGFRLALLSYEHYGLQSTLDHIRKKSSFPVIDEVLGVHKQ